MIRIVLAILALVSVPSVAQAQNMGGAVGFNNVTNSICGGTCRQARQRQDRFFDVRSLNALIANPPQRTTNAPLNVPVNRDFTYRYSAQRTRENLRSFVERSPTQESRADLQRMIADQPTIITDLRAGIAPYGLNPDNVADTYALWLINVWLVANKRDEDPDKGTVAMVKAQISNAFAATPDFASTNDQQRQEYAESLLLQAAMLGTMFEQWKNDPALLDRLSDAAHAGAKASGLDLTTVTLTRNGFVPQQGADASKATGEQDDQTIRNASSEVGSEGSTRLALAAGAALGIVLLGGAAFLRRS